MRKVLTCLTVMMYFCVAAQENIKEQCMYIYLDNNTVECVAVSRIDSITFDAPVFAHEAVDLGLPSGVKWASCNVGASAPEEYGGYYAWGEFETKNEYTVANAIYYQKNIGDDISGTSYDVARVLWGGSWRLPTREEMQELTDECYWEFTLLNDIKGYNIVGPNGNCIFLPAAGYRNGENIFYEGSNGYYWLSSIYCSLNTYFIYYDRTYHGEYYYPRYYGLTIRPVCE